MLSTSQTDMRKTNVAEITFGDRGLILPEESEILKSVIEDFKNAFGKEIKFYDQDNKFLLSTPQGQLVTAWAAIISDRNRLLAYYVNQVDPSYAMGRMQDGIGRIYFIERRTASYTKVTGKCSGKTGTIIPAGTKVQDQQGNIYKSITEGIIEDHEMCSGKESYVNIEFQALEKGSITCPAGTLTGRYQVIAGWESITNEQDGDIGREIESQAQFEQRRRQSIAGNSVNSVDSIMSALLNLVYKEDTDRKNTPICNDAYVTENSLGEVAKKGGVYLDPHSIYVCVSASTDDKTKQEIAKAIWSKKPPGCAMNGDQKVIIYDDQQTIIHGEKQNLYSTLPSYEVAFFYANNVPIKFYIKVARPQTISLQTAKKQIKDAVVAAFSGKDGSERPRIAGQILALSFYTPIQKIGNWAKVSSIQIGRSSGDSDWVQMDINEMPTLIVTDIKVEFNG